MAGPEAEKTRGGRRLAVAVRWLHIYLSMLGFSALLFFSVTGITLNHADWFYEGYQQVTESQGKVPTDWVLADESIPEEARDAEDYDYATEVDRFEIVEHLRAEHQVKGIVTDFGVDAYECVVVFKGPGYSADAFIDRETGEYALTQTSQGAVGILNDLHKGRDTGEAWSWVIDISGGLLTLMSISGLWLLLYLRKRRRDGLVIAVLGTIALVAVFVTFVP